MQKSNLRQIFRQIVKKKTITLYVVHCSIHILYGETFELFIKDILFFCHFFPLLFTRDDFGLAFTHNIVKNETNPVGDGEEIQDYLRFRNMSECLPMIFSKFLNRHFYTIAVYKTRHDLIIICDLFGFFKIPIKINNTCPFYRSLFS